MKKLSLTLVTLFVVAVSLMFSACQSQSKDAPEGQIVLEFWTLQLLTFEHVLQPMIAEYEQMHPHIRIKWVDVPFSEGEKRTLTAMMSANVPDVVNLNPDFSAVLASRNAVLNMNEMVAPEARRQYLPVAWQAATLNRQGEDFVFGLPWYITSSVALYNKQILEKANHAVPPYTYEDLVPFAKNIQENTSAYALMPTIGESGNFLKELKKRGVTLYNSEGQAVFATSEAIQHLQMYIDLYKAGYIPAEAITEGHRAAVDRYQSGTLAMLLTGPNFLNIVQENAPAVFEQTAVAPQFPPDSEYKDFSLMLLVVPKKSEHPKEAVDFALFITNKINQLAFSKAAPILPSITDALKEPYFQMEESENLLDRGRSLSANQLLEATEAYQIRPRQNQINEIINFHVQSALLGRMSAQEALEKAQQAINDLIQSG